MKKRFMTPCAVGALIKRKSENGNEEILLQKRKNDKWDLAVGGHVEESEPITAALIRESYEEIGINVLYEDIIFSTCSYTNFKDRPYTFFYFEIKKYSGIPYIKEPDKCFDLKWFALNNLPDNIIPDVKTVIESSVTGINFLELGWN